MRYCSKCGSQNDPEAEFCQHCGAKLRADDQSNDFDPQTCSAGLFGIVDAMRRIEDNYASIKNTEKYLKILGFLRKHSNALAAAVLVTFGCFEMKPLYMTGSILNNVLLLLTLAVCAALWVKFRLKVIARLDAEIEAQQQKINDYAAANESDFRLAAPVLQKYLPENYWYSTAVESIARYFADGRADNMKEALNLFEEEQSRMRIENRQQAMLNHSRAQTALCALNTLSNVFTNIIFVSELF